MTTKIENNQEYYNQTFDSVSCEQNSIAARFENCTFLNCIFKECQFERCIFVECEFKHCDLSAAKLTASSFSDTNFNSCKMIGINWTQVKWPYIALTAPVAFNDCDISLSSFFELKLSELILTKSKAHDVDFRGCELIGADFSSTDFEKSQFMKTNLKNADLANASNYNINPTENNIKKARFSFPEVCNLLAPFDIKIEGVYDD